MLNNKHPVFVSHVHGAGAELQSVKVKVITKAGLGSNDTNSSSELPKLIKTNMLTMFPVLKDY